MRRGRVALFMLPLLAVGSGGVFPIGGPLTAWASDRGDALIARFPADFGGVPLDVSEHKSTWLLDGLDDEHGGPAKAALVDLLAAHDRTLDDLAVAETEIGSDPDFEDIVVSSVAGVEGRDLVPGLVPAMIYWFDDPQQTQRTFGSTNTLVVSDGLGPLSYPAFHVLYAAGDLVFDVSGTEAMLPSAMDWVAGWQTTAAVASPVTHAHAHAHAGHRGRPHHRGRRRRHHRPGFGTAVPDPGGLW